ncbi:MAG TPA: hypothetical protein DD422_03850 [Akkermansia sp.]|nr:hypothetical protein [Akkermansia sp.]
MTPSTTTERKITTANSIDGFFSYARVSVNLSGWHEAALSGQPPGVDAPAVFSAFSCLKRFENGRAALMSE